MAGLTAAVPWTVRSDGLDIRVRLTPKSSADRIDGIGETADGHVLKARVRAVPEDGKANTAAEILLADWLDVPRRSVAVVSGHKSRVKVLRATGDGAALASKAARHCDAHIDCRNETTR